MGVWTAADPAEGWVAGTVLIEASCDTVVPIQHASRTHPAHRRLSVLGHAGSGESHSVALLYQQSDLWCKTHSTPMHYHLGFLRWGAPLWDQQPGCSGSNVQHLACMSATALPRPHLKQGASLQPARICVVAQLAPWLASCLEAACRGPQCSTTVILCWASSQPCGRGTPPLVHSCSLLCAGSVQRRMRIHPLAVGACGWWSVCAAWSPSSATSTAQPSAWP